MSDKKLTTTWVNGCHDCPMCDQDTDYNDKQSFYCLNPKGDGWIRIIGDDEGIPITPDECPLKQGPILINFK